MPNWKYKAVKIFPIDKLPESGYFLMRHSHLKASMAMVALHGITLPSSEQNKRVRLELTYSDKKDFIEHGILQKEYKCTICWEVETYEFRMRRHGEGRVTRIRDVVVGEARDDN